MKHNWASYVALVFGGVLLAFTGGIMLAGTASGDGPPWQVNDKLLHALVFGVQTGLALFTFRATRLAKQAHFAAERVKPPQAPAFKAELWSRAVAVPKRGELWLSLGYTALTGALLEVLQMFTPTRQADVLDWVADCAGGGAALAVLSASFALGAKLWKRA